MHQEIQAVLHLQRLDGKAAALQKEIAALPKHVAVIERTLEQHVRKLDADKAALAANARDRKRIEDDVKVHELKISKLRDQVLQAKTNEQYRAFQNEIAYADGEIRKCEDRVLDLMGEAEPLEKNVKAAENSLRAEKEQVDREKERAGARTDLDQKFLAEVLEDRKQLVASLSSPVLQAYERVRKKWPGSAISDATDGRCSGCRIALRPQFFQDLKHSDKLMFCESCGRILLYNPPVDLTHEMHEKVAGP